MGPSAGDWTAMSFKPAPAERVISSVREKPPAGTGAESIRLVSVLAPLMARVNWWSAIAPQLLEARERGVPPSTGPSGEAEARAEINIAKTAKRQAGGNRVSPSRSHVFK